MAGIGAVAGSVFGAILFGLTGFSGTLLAFSGLTLVSLIFVIFALPSRLNHITVNNERVGGQQDLEELGIPSEYKQLTDEEMTVWRIITTRRPFWAYLNRSMSQFTLQFATAF